MTHKNYISEKIQFSPNLSDLPSGIYTIKISHKTKFNISISNYKLIVSN